MLKIFFRGTFTALYVETSNTAAMSDDDKKSLQDNKRLDQQLGAAIETSYGDDVPYQIAEFARKALAILAAVRIIFALDGDEERHARMRSSVW